MSPRLRLTLAALFSVLVLALSFALTVGLQEDEEPARDSTEEPELVKGRWKYARPKSSYPQIPVLHERQSDRVARSQPSLFGLDDDRVMLVHVTHELGKGDTLLVSEVTPERVEAGEVVRAPPAEIVRPNGTLNAAGRPQVFWGELVEGVARIFVSERNDEGWSTPQALSTGPGAAFNQECCLDSRGNVWICWQRYSTGQEGRRGAFEVFLGRVEGATLKNTVKVSQSRFSAWDPVLTCDGEGRCWVAWTQYGGRDYEVMLRSFDPSTGELSSPVNLSADAVADDIHPSIAVTSDGALFAAFDSIRDLRRGSSARKVEGALLRGEVASLRVVIYQGGKVQFPVSTERGTLGRTTLFSWSGGLPRLTVDALDRVHLAYRYLDEEGTNGPAHSYPVLTQTFDGVSWSPQQILEGSEGGQQEPALCARETGFWLAWQQDRRIDSDRQGLTLRLTQAAAKLSNSCSVYVENTIGPFGLGVTRVEFDGPRRALEAVPRTALEAATREHPLVDPETNPIILGDRHYEIESDGQTLKAYWGDLHSHSSVSRCLFGIEKNADDRYSFGRDVNLCDFYSLTDHSNHCDPHQWWDLGKLVDLYQSPDFCTLQGFEWSTMKFGHQNVIYRDRLDLLASSAHQLAVNPDLLWDLLPEGDALTIPHHTAHARMATDWDYYNARFLRLVEIFQADRGNFEFDGCFRQASAASKRGAFVQDGLERGLQFGLVASTDHGNGASYAVAFAPELNRNAIFDALYARRCYASTTKGIFLDFRADGKLMGSVITRGAENASPVKLDLAVRGMRELAEVIVFKNGEPFHTAGRTESGTDLAAGHYVLELRWWPIENTDFSFELEVENGTLAKVSETEDDEQDIAGRRGADLWDKTSDTHAVWKQPADFPIRAPVKRFRIRGGEDASVKLSLTGRETSFAISELIAKHFEGRLRKTRVVLRVTQHDTEPVDLDQGMGVLDYRVALEDDDVPTDRPSWYYARVIQTDGEMAWTSPVFLERK